MNTKYRCCIFDLDGTLINTLEALTRTINLTLKEFGLEPVDQAHTRKFVGDGYKLFVERAFAFRGQQDPERIRQAQARYSQLFQENCLYHVEAYPGIPHLLAFLKERGIRTAVLSNKGHEEAVRKIEAVFGAGCFDHHSGKIHFAMSPRENGLFSGTGDLFASVLLGALLRGETLAAATTRAVDFVQKSIARTLAAGTPALEGVQFEAILGELL